MRLLAFDRLDRYTLRVFAAPLAAVLTTLLVAQLLERLLRLLNLAASAGAPLSSVGVMLANLVPHYLGLTLPMAFTAAIFMAAARLADDSELDILLATGRSISRIAAPFFALALLLVPVDLFLFGQWQPLSRYAYHLAMNAALQTGWNARLEERRFIDAGNGTTFSVGAVAADGRRVDDVFLVRRERGIEEVTTAEHGELRPGAGGHGLTLRLEDGRTLRRTGDGWSIARFAEDRIDRDLSPAAAPYRARGDSLNERTLAELWRSVRTTGDAGASAELHGRLARVALLPLLPLMALPLGMASKRGRRTPGVVFAALALVGLNHALQFGESLGESGRLPAALAVWTPLVLFGLVSLWIFRGSLAWPGDNPVSRAVAAIERVLDGLLPRRWRRRASGDPGGTDTSGTAAAAAAGEAPVERPEGRT